MRSKASRMLVLGLIFGLVPATTAHATDRYVDTVPGADDPTTCLAVPPAANACDLVSALGAPAVAGDTVIASPGTYDLAGGSLGIADTNLKLVGPGAGQATITTNAPSQSGVFILSPGVVVSGFHITNSGASGVGLQFGTNAGGGIGEGLSVTTASGDIACRFGNGGTASLRDSVCSNTNPSGTAAIASGPGAAPTDNLTNVTAYATGASTFALLAQTVAGQNKTVNVRNSAFVATNPNTIFAQNTTGDGTKLTVDIDYSIFGDIGTQATIPTDLTITNPGPPTNITGTPTFADTDVVFHQAAGSPTIDKGSATFLAAPFLDIDGAARSVGSAPDIGADEFVPTVPMTPPPVAAGPTGQRAAALKKCKKKKGAARKKCKKKAKKLPV
jgi:hypothetical protein